MRAAGATEEVARLLAELMEELGAAKAAFEASGTAARRFKDFTNCTLKSWRRPRRVVGKGEHLARGANPRFVVASLKTVEIRARALYEALYCARGGMENRIEIAMAFGHPWQRLWALAHQHLHAAAASPRPAFRSARQQQTNTAKTMSATKSATAPLARLDPQKAKRLPQITRIQSSHPKPASIPRLRNSG